MAFSSGTYSLYTPGNPVVTGTTIASTWCNNTLNDIATALSTCLLKDGTQTVTANIPMAAFKLTGLGAGSAAGNSVRWEQSAVGVVTTKGDTIAASASGTIARVAVGSDGQALVNDSNQTAGAKFGYPALRSHLAGLTLSTAGGSATMTTAAGGASDSTNAQFMTLASATGKTTSAWAVGTGNGGLDTGAIANSTWYHFYLIMRGDTGVVDVLFSLSATAPTMPANYTYKRRIGSGKTDGSAQWTAFTQDGDYFRWSASILDVNANNPGAAAVSRTLTVPTGINVEALFNALIIDTAVIDNAFFSDLAANDEAGAGAAAPLTQLNTPAFNVAAAGAFRIRTNTSAQIRSRAGGGVATFTLRIATWGWVDRRGRDA